MVSLVLLILAPVLILTAVIVAGIALFAPGPSKPKPKVTSTLTTPLVPTSNVIFTTRIPPEKEKVTTTALLPSNIVATKPSHSIVDKIPPSSLSSAIVIATTKVSDVVTTTSKIPEVVTTTSPVPAVLSDENIKEKNKDGKDKKDDKEEEEDDWEDDDDDEEEEEVDESPSINGTTGIQAVDASDSRHVGTVKYESGSNKRKSSINKKKRAVRIRRFLTLKQGGQVVDAQAKSINESNNKDEKPAVVEELQKRIDEIVKEQSASFEAKLFRIMTDLLDSQDAVEYQDVLSHIETTTRQEDSDSSVNDNEDTATQTTFHAQADVAPAPAPGFNPRVLLNILLQPFIIQFRTDVRNTVIFICGGQHDSLIDSMVDGNDEYAKKAAQDDIIATTHPDGVHFADLYDPKTAALALNCLKTHFGHLTAALGKLLVDRFASAKEFLLQQVASLAGIPRFMIPLSEEGEEDKGAAAFAAAVAVAAGDASVSSEEERERIERSGAFAEWLVDSMVHEFQLAVEQDQELASGGRSNIASVANLPDA